MTFEKNVEYVEVVILPVTDDICHEGSLVGGSLTAEECFSATETENRFSPASYRESSLVVFDKWQIKQLSNKSIFGRFILVGRNDLCNSSVS